MKQKVIIESLAMDLKRVAIGLYKGSDSMANRFKEEALKRQVELETQEINDYLKNLLSRSKKVLKSHGERVAEDALMYSTLFQNYAIKKFLRGG